MSLSPAGRLGTAWQRMADREAQQLREGFIADHSTRPRPRSLIAAVLAGLILLGYVALVLGGIWLLAGALGLLGDQGPSQRFMPGLVGAALLAFAWIARPVFPQTPGQVVTQTDAPQLHALIAEIATTMEAARPQRVTVIHDVNAFMGQSGFPPRPALGLGLGLWYTLAPQERVAIIAHELAHQKNRDPVRGRLIATALNVLGQVIDLLTPDAIMQAREHEEGGMAALSNLVMRGLALGPVGLYTLLLQLVGAEHQRAEFRADLLAAQVAGHDATLSALDTVHLLNHSSMLETALQRQKHLPRQHTRFWNCGGCGWVNCPASARRPARPTCRSAHSSMPLTRPRPTGWRSFAPIRLRPGSP
ncbi:M48 family metallopeptidase [Deinococcus malanensis]|uniref:M48 family metallopeptidase n=1 Tax=Deinococcus malanensis TaxID=1706855 RepID=UPI00362E50B1